MGVNTEDKKASRLFFKEINMKILIQIIIIFSLFSLMNLVGCSKKLVVDVTDEEEVVQDDTTKNTTESSNQYEEEDKNENNNDEQDDNSNNETEEENKEVDNKNDEENYKIIECKNKTPLTNEQINQLPSDIYVVSRGKVEKQLYDKGQLVGEINFDIILESIPEGNSFHPFMYDVDNKRCLGTMAKSKGDRGYYKYMRAIDFDGNILFTSDFQYDDSIGGYDKDGNHHYYVLMGKYENNTITYIIYDFYKNEVVVTVEEEMEDGSFGFGCYEFCQPKFLMSNNFKYVSIGALNSNNIYSLETGKLHSSISENENIKVITDDGQAFITLESERIDPDSTSYKYITRVFAYYNGTKTLLYDDQGETYSGYGIYYDDDFLKIKANFDSTEIIYEKGEIISQKDLGIEYEKNNYIIIHQIDEVSDEFFEFGHSVIDIKGTDKYFGLFDDKKLRVYKKDDYSNKMFALDVEIDYFRGVYYHNNIFYTDYKIKDSHAYLYGVDENGQEVFNIKDIRFKFLIDNDFLLFKESTLYRVLGNNLERLADFDIDLNSNNVSIVKKSNGYYIDFMSHGSGERVIYYSTDLIKFNLVD